MSSSPISGRRPNALDLFQHALNGSQSGVEKSLTLADRDALRAASGKIVQYATFGAVVGLGGGLLVARRARSAQNSFLRVFRVAQQPTVVQFADGRMEALPDVSSMLQLSRIRGFFKYASWGFIGAYVGAAVGGGTGAQVGETLIHRSPEACQRIEAALRRFRMEKLRKELDVLERQERSGSTA